MSRCESRCPYDPNMQCAASEGHTGTHRLGGIAWADSDFNETFLKGVGRGLGFGPVPDRERDGWEQAEIAIRQLIDEDEAVDVLLTLRRLGFHAACPPPEEEK